VSRSLLQETITDERRFNGQGMVADEDDAFLARRLETLLQGADMLDAQVVVVQPLDPTSVEFVD